MSEIKTLKYWCHPILPLVYDDSLSYYEVLCKVSNKINEVIETLNGYTSESEAITALQSAVSALQTGVQNNLNAIEALEKTDNALKAQIDTLNADYEQTKALVQNINVIIEGYTNYVDAQVDAVDAKLQKQLFDLQVALNVEVYNLSKAVDELAEQIKKISGIDVYNYSANARLTLDNNNWKLYNDLENSISAEEYCKLGLSADDYKKQDISAIDYLRDSKKRLHLNWVYFGVAGTKQEINNALTEIFNEVKGTLTSDEYTELGLDADAYSALGFTNTQYREYNPLRESGTVTLGGNGLTVTQYSALRVN